MNKELEEKIDKGIKAVRALINESDGVAGLHMNGDDAPWDELLHGRFGGWLNDFVDLERTWYSYQNKTTLFTCVFCLKKFHTDKIGDFTSKGEPLCIKCKGVMGL